MEEVLDHNTALARLIETGDTEDVQMILGHKDRLRCGGIIRTGVKVLKSGASPQEIAKFNELEAQGMPYDSIDEALGGRPRSKDSKLYPKNVDHFVVRPCDFSRASDADYILNNFTDKDGDKKLRRFPIWLSIGELDKVLHHNFKAFNGSGRVVASSFYEGKKLMVRFLPKGFRDVPKKTDWEIAPLDPDNPVSPAGHKLDFGGIMRFNIPGLRGFDEIIIPTRSWFGIGSSVALLRRVRSVLGRFNGLLDQKPFLEIAKVAEEVTDPKGNRVTQYIPVIQLSIDPMELAAYAEMAPSRGAAAIQMFNGASRKASPQAQEDLPQEESQPDEAPFGDEDPAITKAMEALHGAIKWLGVPWEAFASYVEHDYPAPVEKLTIEQLRGLYADVQKQAKSDKEGFAALINDIHRSLSEESGGDLPFN